MVGIEQDLALEQGAGEGEQAIAGGAQGAAVAVAASAQRGIALATDRIVLGGDTNGETQSARHRAHHAARK